MIVQNLEGYFFKIMLLLKWRLWKNYIII